MKISDKIDKDKFSEEIELKVQRKQRAQHNDKKSIWFGLGMMGIVGWSITVPTLLGVALGIWLDKKYPESLSWTLSFLILGLCLGCLISWHWLSKEHKDMNENRDENDK
jgi:ATP synthase protein I